MEISVHDKQMQQGDPARYGSGIGQWPLPLPGAATARMGALLAAVTDAAQAAAHRLADLPRPASARAWIAIGPEGGWSPADRGLLHAAGFSGLHLGPRVLRTETAGLAAIAALQSRFGDL